jgi:CBS domain-containing protein
MSRPAITINPEARLKEALVVIDEHSITSMPVVDSQGRLVGVISEANLIQNAVRPDERKHLIPVHMDEDARPYCVADVMSRQVLSVNADDDVTDAVALMTGTVVKSLPVLSEGRVVGMLSRRDIVHALARRDGDIHDAIERLAHAAGYAWRIAVDSGAVTIEGAATDSETRLARGLAASVAGVVAVHVHPTEGAST